MPCRAFVYGDWQICSHVLMMMSFMDRCSMSCKPMQLHRPGLVLKVGHLMTAILISIGQTNAPFGVLYNY